MTTGEWPPFTGRWRDLARYVSVDAVAPMGLGDPEAHLRRSNGSLRQANREVIRTAYENLARRRIPYGMEPYVVGVDRPQVVRHPQRLDTDAGTCVDLAVLFAAVCLAAEVAPYIVVSTQRSNSGQDIRHAIVVLDLDRRHANGWDDPGRGRLTNLLASDGVAAIPSHVISSDLSGGRYLAIDQTLAARRPDGDPLDFEEAVERSATTWYGAYDDVWVDVVAVLEEEGSFDPPPPDERGVITRRTPASTTFRTLSEDRAALVQELKGAAGVVGLIGDPGVGKSMLALEVAGAFGWFVNASSKESLEHELATFEAREQTGVDRVEVGVADEPDLLQQARERLSSTRVPWTVVLDNANLADGVGPEQLLQLVPTPRVECQQRIIVTSTDPTWNRAVGVFKTVEPLIEEFSHYPEVLHVLGRPLFASAYERMATAVKTTVADLAGRLPAEAEAATAEQALWAIATSVLDPEAVALARHVCWAAIDDVDGSAVADGAGLPHDAFHRLVYAGLLEALPLGRGRMHRLVAAAVRAQHLHEDASGAAVAAAHVLGAPTVVLDREAINVGRALADTPDRLDSPALGRLKHAVGTRLEPLSGVRMSAPYFSDALPLLPQEDVRRKADCLHSEVRCRYQFEKSEESLVIALESAEACLRLRDEAVRSAGPEESFDVLVEQQRSLALEGLVKVELAVQRVRKLEPADSSGMAVALALAEEGSAAVDASYRYRLDTLRIPPGDPDVLRARFNQGMAGVNLAQLVDEATAALHLDRAEQAYTDVRDAREHLRPKVRPHLASCHAGLGLVGYLRFVRARGAPAGLRDATRHLLHALRLREEIENIDDGDEVAKTMHVLAKLSVARLASSKPNSAKAEQALVDLRSQLRQELPVVAQAWPDSR